MNNQRPPLLLVFVIILFALSLAACQPKVGTPQPGLSPTAGTTLGGSEVTPTLGSDPYSPTPTMHSPGIDAEYPGGESVRITWEMVSGADQYLLELQVGDAFTPIASLPASQTSFLDANVPSGTQLTYRLSSITNTVKDEGRMITVETPHQDSNPMQVGIEYDVAPPSLVFDPENMDASTIDPENFDPAMFMPQPLEASAVIGPAGGELSVTGTNGVTYTLVVPPDALRIDMPIKLKPISALSDLPLSGGMMAAVFIEPASLVFEVPARLEMTPPPDFAAPSAPLLVAFAFEAEGQDFHLYPLHPDSVRGSLGQKTASLGFVPALVPPLSDIAAALYGGGYGEGSASMEEVKKITKRSPAKSQNRTAQKLAASQLDELTPLTKIENDELATGLSNQEYELAKISESIQQKTSKADDWAKFMEAMEDARTFLNSVPDDYSPVQVGKIIELLAGKAKALLDKNKRECITFDDFMAQDLVERLTNPKDKFSKQLALVFNAKYGQKLLKSLALEEKNCTFELSLNSKLTFTSAGSTLTTYADAPKVKLALAFSKGDLYLWGGGPMQMRDQVSGICNYPLKHYDKLTFMVEMLSPIFQDGVLVDFRLKYYTVDGWTTKMGIQGKSDKKGCPTVINLQGGGDFWTGLFTILRIDSPIIDWKLSNPTNGGKLTATWNSDIPYIVPMGISESSASEKTTIVLTVTKNKK